MRKPIQEILTTKRPSHGQQKSKSVKKAGGALKKVKNWFSEFI
jgi:hypothetical protein